MIRDLIARWHVVAFHWHTARADHHDLHGLFHKSRKRRHTFKAGQHRDALVPEEN